MTTAYINLTTNEYPKYAGDIELSPNDIFVKVDWTDKPEFNINLQRCFETYPIEINGFWKMVWCVRDATQEEIDQDNKRFIQNTEAL